MRVDVGRLTSGARRGVFLGTLSPGVCPGPARERERWSDRIGGRARPLWPLFAGNGAYHRMGLAPRSSATTAE